MKLLALTGSPRKGGNTETLVAAITAGATAAGAECETIRLPELRISPCIGCGGCNKTGHCVIEDDMQALYGKIDETRIVLIASPIYFYGVSAQTKAFIDRNQALWSRKQLLLAEHKWSIDPLRKGHLVSVAATSGTKVFIGAQLCVQYAFDAMGIGCGDDFLVRGVDQRGAMKKMVYKLAEAEDFGRKIAQPEAS